jgi:hypothetical protein
MLSSDFAFEITHDSDKTPPAKGTPIEHAPAKIVSPLPRKKPAKMNRLFVDINPATSEKP